MELLLIYSLRGMLWSDATPTGAFSNSHAVSDSF